MLRHVRMVAVARVAAALVAVTLSGVPRVLALHAPAERHRCTCQAHSAAHECDCALCHKAALLVQAGDESLPPCHRAAAQRELASADRGEKTRGEPCVEGTCGSGARPTLTLAGVEVFCVPASAPVVIAVPERPLRTVVEPVPERALEPETPPPKPA